MTPEEERPSLKGRLVVATPALADPNFHRTVVLVLEHGDEGALGVVLNRPTETVVGDALPEWSDLASAPGVVFSGGPVEPTAVIAVARAHPAQRPEHMAEVAADVGVIDLHAGADSYVGHLTALRMFAGYSGWGAEQIEEEIDEGAWWVLDSQPADAVSTDPSELWWTVVGRQPDPRFARLANYPPDPSFN